jgi:hypothetical protein
MREHVLLFCLLVLLLMAAIILIVAPGPVTWALSLIEWYFKKAQTKKFAPPDTCLEDYEKRRSAFLKKLIASTPLAKGGHQVPGIRKRRTAEEPNYRHRRLLRARRERPRRRRAAEQRDELAAAHSITSSARPSSVIGNVMPSAFAVLRFTYTAIRTSTIKKSSAVKGPRPRKAASIQFDFSKN